MDELKPGDLCVIVDHPEWRPTSPSRGMIGKHVVLVRPADPDHVSKKWQPGWVAIGLGPRWDNISAKILRRIPPSSLETDQPTEEELLV